MRAKEMKLSKALLKEYMKYGKYAKYAHVAGTSIKSRLVNNGSFSYRKTKHKMHD